MFAYRLTFNPRSKATNIDYRLPSGAVFGWRSKIRINVEEFGDSPESGGCSRDEILKIDIRIIRITEP